MKARAILYARFSTERQNEASVADQLRVCAEFAAAREWPIAARFSDEGISGAALGNRPGVREAFDTAAAGDVLLVTDLSRLSRSQDLAPLLARLKHRGVRVIGVQDGFDTDTRHARMQAGLSGIMSEEFRAMVADRTHSALEMRAKSGEATGGKAFDDPEIIVEIFTRFAAGQSMKAIASDLNRRGVPSPGAAWKERARPRGRWLVSTLHAMLRNERYIGRLIWNRSRWIKDPDTGIRKRIERPEREWVVRSCERIIGDDLWQRAQARFRTRIGRGGAPRWLLSGILECAVCGGKMICYGGGQHRYVCGTHHAGGEHACANASTFPREVAERLILAPVLNDLLSPAAIEEGVRLMKRERIQPPKPESADRELVELERLVRDGVLSPEIAAPAIEAARAKADTARREAPIPVQAWPSERVWREAVQSMRLILQGDDIGTARELLRDLIGPAKCHPAEAGTVAVQLTTRRVLLAIPGPRARRADGALVANGGTVSSRSIQCTPPLPTDLPIVIRVPISTRGRK